MDDLNHPVFSFDTKVGHPLVDAQHADLARQIFKLIAVAEPETKAQFVRQGKTILRAFKAHFETEESILEAVGYPDLAAHKAHHDDQLAEANNAFRNIEFGGDLEMADSLKVFDNLFSDIVEADKPAADYFQRAYEQAKAGDVSLA